MGVPGPYFHYDHITRTVRDHDPLRYHKLVGQSESSTAERAAHFFGTARYLVIQTVVLIGWLALNTVATVAHWDVYPFILLNLVFATQAAYAVPLVLLAQNREAARDREQMEADALHREAIARLQGELLAQNVVLTEQVRSLSQSIVKLLSGK